MPHGHIFSISARILSGACQHFSTLQPSAVACQLLPLRPRLAAHKEPPPVAVRFYARGETFRQLTEVLKC
jgi:hypothetical protein